MIEINWREDTPTPVKIMVWLALGAAAGLVVTSAVLTLLILSY